MNTNYITVTQLTKYIKYKIDNDQNLIKVYLKGEVSNFKSHTRGHLYFTIKDEGTRINAVMFSSSAEKLNFEPKDGMTVLVTGRVSVYESTGSYQIYVDKMEEDGLGNLYIAFEKLKKKLEGEGLFEPIHKKQIPKMPKTIGIITAPTGAAIKDILSTIKRRWPIAETILFPSLVQGAEAAEDIVKNIELTRKYELDVLIIGRGGGSIEDMWCFNEEIVARAIYELKVPVISAVDHEIDFTISDFVADLRAPTPTGAAEMAVPSIVDIINLFENYKIRLTNNLANIINTKKEYLNALKNNYILKNPINMYQIKEEKFDNLYERLILSYKNIASTAKNKLMIINSNLTNNITNNYKSSLNKYLNILNKLEALNPLSTLKRGYSIVKKDNGVIDSITKIKTNDLLEIELIDGLINVKVQ